MRERVLSFEERVCWGECPVCHAPDGDWCHAEVGIHFGVKINGERMNTGEGAHVGRLQRAPYRVKLVAMDGY